MLVAQTSVASIVSNAAFFIGTLFDALSNMRAADFQSRSRVPLGSEVKRLAQRDHRNPGVSFQRCDRQKWKLLPGAIPVIPKFREVHGSPLIDEIKSRSREMPFVDCACLNLNQGFVFAV